MLEHIELGLKNLEHMAEIYDGGHHYIAFAMATEARRILTEGPVATRVRGGKSFNTPKTEVDNERNVLATNKLVSVQIQSSPPALSFLPALPSGDEVQALVFRDWWNRDIIYRAGGVPVGTPQGTFVRWDEMIPFRQRETVTRRQFVDLLRNKLGSHMPEEIPKLLDDLTGGNLFGVNFSVPTESGFLSVMDGTLPVKVGAAPAMMRQIVHELLEAYAA